MMRSRRQGVDRRATGWLDEWSYRSAICAYVITEASHGVRRDELAGMGFGGRPAEEEAEHLDEALSHLCREGHIRIRGEAVFPVGSDQPRATR